MCDVNKFIKEQVKLLKYEKNCYSQQVENDKKLTGTLVGTVVRKTEPSYGGTIVTLLLRSSLRNVELPFKQHNPIGLQAVDKDEIFRGIVILIK